jgi:hypothetical protein
MGAKEMQAKPKESKKKSLHFPWISVAESSLFNALRRIQIKKSYFLATRVLGCAKRLERSFSPTLPPAGGGLESGQQKTITRTYDFRKQLRRRSPWFR